jgi:FkbM family methyltransferase
MSKAAQLLDEPEPLHRLPYLPLGLKETRYGNMIFLPHDDYIGRSIIQLGEFSYGEARLIEQSLGPGMTALDVGAHIGTLTLPMVKAVGKTGRVLAFEPQIVLYLLLCANMALNNASRITCYRAVVGNRAGKINMPAIDYSASRNFGGYGEEHFMVEGGQREQGDDIIDLLTIDQLDLDACHFMKIDVEGMEKKVLEGARETIKRFNPVMLIENDRRLRAKALIEYIEELNYKAYWHTPAFFNETNFAKNPENNFGDLGSADVLCVPSGRNADLVGMTRCRPEDAVHPACLQD